MRDFFTANGGDGAGKVRYELYFNVIWSPNKFGLFPESSTLAPNADVRYKNIFTLGLSLRGLLKAVQEPARVKTAPTVRTMIFASSHNDQFST